MRGVCFDFMLLLFLYFYGMRKKWHVILYLAAALLLNFTNVKATTPEETEKAEKALVLNNSIFLHNDSIHSLNFRYADRKRGFKPFIAPTALIAGGVAFHFSDLKYDFNDWRSDHFNYHGDVDDYLRLAPIAAVYSLNAFGVKGKNDVGNATAILLKSVLINTVVVRILKDQTKVQRPTGDMKSFPSGHTSIAFGLAQWMHHEYGERSAWYSIGAYASASAVGVMRIAKGAHWASDVVAGAGIGILTTELVYLTHQYKWDWEHVRRLDILPFATSQQKGVTLVYTF